MSAGFLQMGHGIVKHRSKKLSDGRALRKRGRDNPIAPSLEGGGTIDGRCLYPKLRSGIRALALDKYAAFGADTHAIHSGAIELRRADRLIDRRTFVEVRLELLALVEREIYRDGIRGWHVRILRRASAEREHPQRRGQRRGRNHWESPFANFRADNFSSAHRVLLSTGLRRSSA